MLWVSSSLLGTSVSFGSGKVYTLLESNSAIIEITDLRATLEL